MQPADLKEYIKKCGKIFYTANEWADFFKKGDFSFSVGSRFHGNMMALRNQIPALWVVHDMRTKELVDTLKVPNLDIDVLKKYEELMENGDGTKLFYAADGDVCSIKNAIQTIKFTLDKTGGKIKSEAVIEMTKDSAMIMDPEEVEYRYFEFDSEFTIFLREEGKDKPYFAANIDDITLFQE